jgi:hypothetical protein
MPVTFSPKTISAVQQIRKMRGGSQAHLMRADDGAYWIVKFHNNPQHFRVLANEFFASRIGSYLGLPIPEVAVIDVSEWLIQHTPEMRIDVAGYAARPCSHGLQLASRYIVNPQTDMVFDYLPESLMKKSRHIADEVTRVLVLDKWTGNTDGRQAVFTKPSYANHYDITFIDQGYSFNAEHWNFPDIPLTGVYYRNFVYEHVTGWESFEPVLSRAEAIDAQDLWKLAQGMPEQWWNRDSGPPESISKQWWEEKFPTDLAKLIDTLYQRRSKIRDVITAFRESSRDPFPNWAGS